MWSQRLTTTLKHALRITTPRSSQICGLSSHILYESEKFKRNGRTNVILFGILLGAISSVSLIQISYLESDQPNVTEAQSDHIEADYIETEEETEQWEIKKEQCSFCKFFLESPCMNQFKRWSKCVDAAKKEEKDYVEECSSFTQALMVCTANHSDYFTTTREDTEADDENEEKEPKIEQDQKTNPVEAVP